MTQHIQWYLKAACSRQSVFTSGLTWGILTNGQKVGWKNDVQGREKAYAATDWVRLPERIMQAAERLRGVQIENHPALEIMERFNFANVLMYLDPPYITGTRHGKQYRHEMYSVESHEELLEKALAHKGPLLISGYDSPLYRDMLRGWHREETVSYSQVCSKKREVLWMNFEPAVQIRLDFEEMCL